LDVMARSRRKMEEMSEGLTSKGKLIRHEESGKKKISGMRSERRGGFSQKQEMRSASNSREKQRGKEGKGRKGKLT